jgi:hypothetical protein
MTIRPLLISLLGAVLLSGCAVEPGYYPNYSYPYYPDYPYYAPYYDYGGSELWFGGGYWGGGHGDHNWHHGGWDHGHGDHGGPQHHGGRK